MIKVEQLTKTFPLQHKGESIAVNDITFEVKEGEFFTLLGPSGCGKTTTLRCIAGLERPSAGTIEIGGQLVYRNKVLVPTNERDLGMVFQSYAVWPHMSVFENAAFPLTVSKDRPRRAQIRTTVEGCLELVGLGGFGDRMVTQLSGGQQQRLSLARALVSSPSVLLLDEPLSNLDAKLRERMRSELREIQQDIGITTLFVTHDQVEALSMSDRIAVMRDGKVVQMGEPGDVYHRPTSVFVAHFIGGTNMITGTVTAADSSGATIASHLGAIRGVCGGRLHPGDTAVAAIRLEDAVLDTEPVDTMGLDRDNLLVGTIGLRLFNGSSVDYRVEVDQGHLQVRVESRSSLTPGAQTAVVLPPERVRILPSDDDSVAQESPAAAVEV